MIGVAYDIADTIYYLRARTGKSQKQLAKEAGVGQDYISRLEQGKRKPSLETLQQIVVALGQKRMSQFFELAEKINSDELKGLVEVMKNREKQLELIEDVIKDLSSYPALFIKSERGRIPG